ncbi:MAG: hypothetical protein WAZ98_06350 [Cyclobacteriaceae bacterium]
MKKLSFSFALIILASSSLFSQTTGDYRSNAATFNWNATASWQRWNGSAWVSNPAEGYPGQNATGIAGTVTIQNGHTVTGNVDVTTNDIGNLILQGSGILSFNNNTDIDATGNLTMDGTSQIQGNGSSRVLRVTGNFDVPVTATNARIAGITLTINGTTTVPGTLTLNNNNGVKTFSGRVTVSGSWTSTAITSTNRLVFGGEVITSGVFDCGCN